MSQRDDTTEELETVSRAEVIRGLRVTYLATALGSAYAYVVAGVVFTGFALALGASYRQIGFLIGAMPLGAVAQLFGSYLIQRTGRRRRLFVVALLVSRGLWAFIVMTAFLGGPAFRWRVPLVFAMLVASNLLGALASNAWMSWMGDLIPAEIRSRYLGTRQAISSAVGAATGLLAAAFMDWWERGITAESPEHFLGFAVAFAAAMSVGIVDVLLYRFVPHPAVDRDAKPPTLAGLVGEVFGNRNFRRLILLFGWWNLAVGVAMPFFNVYLLEDLKLSYTHITIFGILSSGVWVFMSYSWGRVLGLLGSKFILGVCFLAAALSPALYVATSPERVWPVALAFSIGAVGWSGVFMIAMNMSIALSPRRARSAYMACFGMTGVVLACGHALGGQLAHMLEPVAFTMWGLRVAHLQVLFLISAALRLSCLIPLVGVEDVERPAEGYPLLRAWGSRSPFRALARVYRPARPRTGPPTQELRRSGGVPPAKVDEDQQDTGRKSADRPKRPPQASGS